MKKLPINYFYGNPCNKGGEDTFWENAMIRLSEDYSYIYKRYDFVFKRTIPFEYKHIVVLKQIGNIPLLVSVLD